ncbi:MAG: hypothetical protein GX130_03255 [Candidatus Hydrogenedens sp.]|jgi:hypothetical protein|nr:hypothetical protein [Candidatus Hydrogenedens sp.]
MKNKFAYLFFLLVTLSLLSNFVSGLPGDDSEMEAPSALDALATTGLEPEEIACESFHKGETPRNFKARSGAPYKPSYNEEPNIPAQCWIETGYGTQNACLFCHSDYLSREKHGNNYPIADDQVLYSFPSPDLNKVLWRNTIYPQEITARLEKEGIALPDPEDLSYMRQDNWKVLYDRVRPGNEKQWVLPDAGDFLLFPALNPAHLFPEVQPDPTDGNSHGYIDADGFVRDERANYTGWRAVNFFPYGIFTPLTGSVSGIYIRLPGIFRTDAGIVDLELYKRNLDILERNIKNQPLREKAYLGDAYDISVDKGLFPVGTEFAHPLHYVDLKADGEVGENLDGVANQQGPDYEFPGTRSKRVKEIRYMYKWKSVEWEELEEDAHPDDYVLGHEGQGWIDNNMGWILAGYIENRQGELRTQTTEELMQCLGCHGMTGNTVDSVWSFPRKLPGAPGWREMDYGAYKSDTPGRSTLRDYEYEKGLGEMGFFYKVVVGADLFGVMPAEIAETLRAFGEKQGEKLALAKGVDAVLDDSLLSQMPREERKLHLEERQKLMRAFVDEKAYLDAGEDSDELFIKGTILYPSEDTMKKNLQLYRQIVLDQSFNLGKDVFGSEEGHVPFTFRSDGEIKNARGEVIPLGEIIASRPYDEDGEGTTPTGIVAVDEDGEPVDSEGNAVDMDESPEEIVGHISTGGTFEPWYNPILNDKVLTK